MMMMMLFPFAHMTQQTINEGGLVFLVSDCPCKHSQQWKKGQHACDA
jgi:hypothetical protein